MAFIDRIREKESVLPGLLQWLSSQSRPLLFFGAGNTARYFFRLLSEFHIPVCDVVVDGEYWTPGQCFEGREVKTLEGSLNQYGQADVFLAFTTTQGAALKNRLVGTGKVRNVYFLDDPAIFNGVEEFYDYRLIRDNLEKFEELYVDLEDELSRRVLCTFINQRISGKMGYLDDVWTRDDYRPQGIFEFTRDEVCMDCGAYTGDTLKELAHHLTITGGRCIRFIAFEPDKTNFQKLRELQKSLPFLWCINKGVWNQETKLRFLHSGTVSSGITGQGEDWVEVDSIDNTLKGAPATYIKMDVEGAELQALAGAHHTITTFRPKLAVCVYHKKDDLLTIPQYIKTLVPGYKLYLRIHRPFSKELVLYASI